MAHAAGGGEGRVTLVAGYQAQAGRSGHFHDSHALGVATEQRIVRGYWLTDRAGDRMVNQTSAGGFGQHGSGTFATIRNG